MGPQWHPSSLIPPLSSQHPLTCVPPASSHQYLPTSIIPPASTHQSASHHTIPACSHQHYPSIILPPAASQHHHTSHTPESFYLHPSSIIPPATTQDYSSIIPLASSHHPTSIILPAIHQHHASILPPAPPPLSQVPHCGPQNPLPHQISPSHPYSPLPPKLPLLHPITSSSHPNLRAGLGEPQHVAFWWVFPVGIWVSQGNAGSLEQTPKPWRVGSTQLPPDPDFSPWILTRQEWSRDSDGPISRLSPLATSETVFPFP